MHNWLNSIVGFEKIYNFETGDDMAEMPNIVVIMTDQQRPDFSAAAALWV